MSNLSFTGSPQSQHYAKRVQRLNDAVNGNLVLSSKANTTISLTMAKFNASLIENFDELIQPHQDSRKQQLQAIAKVLKNKLGNGDLRVHALVEGQKQVLKYDSGLMIVKPQKDNTAKKRIIERMSKKINPDSMMEEPAKEALWTVIDGIVKKLLQDENHLDVAECETAQVPVMGGNGLIQPGTNIGKQPLQTIQGMLINGKQDNEERQTLLSDTTEDETLRPIRHKNLLAIDLVLEETDPDATMDESVKEAICRTIDHHTKKLLEMVMQAKADEDETIQAENLEMAIYQLFPEEMARHGCGVAELIIGFYRQGLIDDSEEIGSGNNGILAEVCPSHDQRFDLMDYQED